MHEITLDALPGDGDGLGNCMQTKLTADSNVSGNANVSTIKTDAVLIKPVGGTLAMLTNVDTLKEEPGRPRRSSARPRRRSPARPRRSSARPRRRSPARPRRSPARPRRRSPARPRRSLAPAPHLPMALKTRSKL